MNAANGQNPPTCIAEQATSLYRWRIAVTRSPLIRHAEQRVLMELSYSPKGQSVDGLIRSKGDLMRLLGVGDKTVKAAFETARWLLLIEKTHKQSPHDSLVTGKRTKADVWRATLPSDLNHLGLSDQLLRSSDLCPCQQAPGQGVVRTPWPEGAKGSSTNPWPEKAKGSSGPLGGKSKGSSGPLGSDADTSYSHTRGGYNPYSEAAEPRSGEAQADSLEGGPGGDFTALAGADHVFAPRPGLGMSRICNHCHRPDTRCPGYTPVPVVANGHDPHHPS